MKASHISEHVANIASLDNHVGSRRQDRHGGNNGEETEGDQADPVQNHCGEFPVVLDVGGIVLGPDLVADHPDLLEDVDQLAVDSRVSKTFPKLVKCH